MILLLQCFSRMFRAIMYRPTLAPDKYALYTIWLPSIRANGIIYLFHVNAQNIKIVRNSTFPHQPSSLERHGLCTINPNLVYLEKNRHATSRFWRAKWLTAVIHNLKVDFATACWSSFYSP